MEQTVVSYSAECVEKFGAEQVKIWRRSYDTPPPPMDPTHPFYNSIVHQDIYQDVLKKEDIPVTESLKDLIEQRTGPFWRSFVEPDIRGKRVIIHNPIIVLFN